MLSQVTIDTPDKDSPLTQTKAESVAFLIPKKDGYLIVQHGEHISQKFPKHILGQILRNVATT